MKNDFRQKFHLEPKKGWLNDPNGLCYFNGKYHVYFQYSPESPYGKGEKCWGHFESPDMIHWTFCGTVLRPDCPDDKSGVYSGCGFVKEDTLYLFYTGNVKKDGDFDYITAGREANVMLVTTKDGQHMSKKRTLLKNCDYPKNCSCHVRDPKVWEENGVYNMVLGARTLDNRGSVLYYTSKDLIRWEFLKEESYPDFGYMWECPDVIELGGKKYLSISPQGVAHGKFSHQNVYSSGYFCGKNFIEWDYGFDFYAPQTFLAPDGRKIMIGWMGIGDIPYTNPTAKLGWQHCLTVMRELSIDKDGEISALPVSELLSLRDECTKIAKNGYFSCHLPFELDGNTGENFSLTLCDYLSMSFKSGIFTLSFLDQKVSGGREQRFLKISSLSDIRILFDTSSVEIYLNGGKRVMSTRFYPDDTETQIKICDFYGDLYKLKGINVLEGAENE